MFAILCLGDSITFGRGESPNTGWVGRLKKDFEPKGFHNCVYNLGVPGDTSSDLLKRMQSELRSRIKLNFPDDRFIVMIAIGINDSKAIGNPSNLQTQPETFRKNISNIIKIAKKYTKEVILVGLTPVDEDLANPFEDTYFTNSRIKEYNEMLKENNVLFIELFQIIMKKEYKKLLSDGLHPNKEGYDEIYKVIKDFLLENKCI